MVCPNCGFESDNKFCPMCGSKIPEQPIKTVADTSAEINNQTDFNQVYPTQNFSKTPVTAPYPAPPYNSEVPEGMPLPQYENSKPKKSNSTILAIVLTAIVLAVIAAGIVISIYSHFTYNKSIISAVAEDFIDEDLTINQNFTSDYYGKIV